MEHSRGRRGATFSDLPRALTLRSIAVVFEEMTLTNSVRDLLFDIVQNLG